MGGGGCVLHTVYLQIVMGVTPLWNSEFFVLSGSSRLFTGYFACCYFQVGGKRCFDLNDKQCILSQLGSGPDSTTSGTGHYSVNEYKEILRYAKERHIQVIPEFDMPGHGNAAIKAMLARYNKLSAQGDKSGGEKYLLSEANDTSRYLSIQHFSDDAINPCIESTYNFVEHLVEAVVNIHNDTQPLTIFHFGGDEVAHGAWINSFACGKLVQRLGLGSSGGKIADEVEGLFCTARCQYHVKLQPRTRRLGRWSHGCQ